MRTVCVFFSFLLPVLCFAQPFKVSQLKFQNFKAYEAYGIELETVRSVLLDFSRQNPSFEREGLFRLAAELSEIYRSRGLSFHRVEVVLGNPTRLVLIPGVMSAVDVRGNQRYRTSQLEPFFDGLFGELVDAQTLGEAMTRMNSLPGLSGFAFLSFGEQPGDAVLNVSVNQESWGQLSTRLNNFGSTSTGDYRLSSQLTLNNPLKLSEQWRLGGSVSDETENWGANIAVDFHRRGNHLITLNGQYQNMALTQSFSLLNLSGWQASGQLGLQSTPIQGFQNTVTWEATVGYLQQSLQNDANIEFFDTELTDVPVKLGLKGDFAGNRTFLGYQAYFNAGYLLDYKASVELPEDYWLLAGGELSFAQSITGGVLQKGIDLKTELQGQYAWDELPSHRRFGLGGPSKLGAFAAGSVTGDTAVYNETSVSLLNVTVGPIQTVLQAVGQAGWGQTGSDETDVLFSLGAVLELDIGPLSTQLKAFSDEEFDAYTLWFDITLDWPAGDAS